MDASEIGRYGTISLMKRLQPDHVVAAFPIDDEQITFGRDPQCSVRLYYNSVSLLHCKIIFQERKAFLVVLGTNGVVIDGCRVFPSTASVAPTTIPLTNNSEIEIHSKRFRFTYPPKELRAVLLATPSRGGPTSTPNCRRALRMSMIQSAQVFSPRPSNNPNDNLRVLQSPIKPFRTPNRGAGAHRQDNNNEDGENDQEIVLVDGNYPRVVEEERDLVILEDVEVDNHGTQGEDQRTPTQQRMSAYPQTPPNRPFFTPPIALRTPQMQPPPQTPRHRVQGVSLHRAVLIRSAQRAVMKAEIEREEVEEEKEVVEFIAPDRALGDGQASASSSQSSEDELEAQEDMQEKDTQEDEEDLVPQRGISRWRDATKVSQSDAATRTPERSDNEEKEESDITDVDLAAELVIDPEEEVAQALESVFNHNRSVTVPEPDVQQQPPHSWTPAQPRRFANFTTPQANRAGVRTQGAGRYSYGGVGLDNGGARRVVVEQAWRVKDIVLPERTTGIKEEQEQEDGRDTGGWNAIGRKTEKQRQQLSDEERKAIQERRRSALRTPDAFFGGQAPGMRRPSALPGPQTLQATAVVLTSPTKDIAQSPAKQGVVKLEQELKVEIRKGRDGIDDDMNTRSLLERMKETVEGMKRRRSMNPRASLGLGMSPRKRYDTGEGTTFSLLAPGVKEGLDMKMEREWNGAPGGTGVGAEVRDDTSAVTGQEECMVFGDKKEGATVIEHHSHIQHGGVDIRSPARELTLTTAGNSSVIKSDMNTSMEEVPIVVQLLPRMQHPTAPTKTPRMDDLRHMFGVPKAAATPSFKGMRDLFAQTEVRVVGTPLYEGVGEMLRTPKGYGREEDGGGEDVEEKVPGEKPVAAKVQSGTLPATTRRRTPRGRATAVDTSSAGDNDGTQPSASRGTRRKNAGRQAETDVEDETAVIAKPKVRLLRGSKNTAGEVIEEQDNEALIKASGSRSVQTKESVESEKANGTPNIHPSPNAQTNPEDIEEKGEAHASSSPPKSTNRRGRSRKAAAEPTTTAMEEGCAPPSAPTKPARKTRTPKAHAQTPSEHESELPILAAMEHTRRVRVRSRAQDENEESPNTAGRTSRPRGQEKVIGIEANDDPLDSIGSPDSEAHQVVAPAAEEIKTARSKAATTEAKDEEIETHALDVPTDVRATGSKKMPGKTTVKPASGSGSRTSARVKGASHSSAGCSPSTAVASDDGVDKENTPRAEDERVLEKPKRAKVSRKRKAPVKVKEDDPVEDDVKSEVVQVTNKTRITRTRSRK